MLAASLLPDDSSRNSCCSDPWTYYDRTVPPNTSVSDDHTTGSYLNATLPDREYYNVWYRIIGSFFLSLIFAIGCTGNAMVVLVVWRCRSMHTPTNCYLVSLAVADLLLLFWATLPTLVEYNMVVDEHISGPVGCSVMVFMQYLGVNVSSLSITALTVERYIAICHPMRAHTICTISRAKRIIAGLWIAGLTYSAPWLALATTYPRQFSDGTRIEYCTFRLPRHDYMIYYLADLILMYAVPLAVNSVLYGLIAWTLYANTVTAVNGMGGTGLLVPNSPYLDTLGRSNHMVSQVIPPRNGATAIRFTKSTSTISSRVQVLRNCICKEIQGLYSAYLPIELSSSLPLSACMSLFSVCLFTYVCLFVCLPLSAWLYLSLSLSGCQYPFFLFLPFSISICLILLLFVCLCRSISV